MVTTTGSLATRLLDGISEVGSKDYLPLVDPPSRSRTPADSDKNARQFLCFLKPELLEGERQDIQARLELVFARLDAFELAIERAMVVSGRYLGQHRIISHHYGVIDRIARDPRAYLPDSGVEQFEELFGRPFEEAHVVGGVEYLRMRPDLTPDALSDAWLAGGYEKLGGGTYCQHLASESLYLFNGFYPKLLKHYTRRSARIAVLVLRGTLEWESARRDLIGSTDPASAAEGSLRRTLLDRAGDLGLPAVSPNLNGVHLSAGPLEALVELIRFTCDRRTRGATHTGQGIDGESPVSRVRDFLFGRQLADMLSEQEIAAILANPEIEFDGSITSVFDLTEELEPHAALAVIEQVRDQLASPAR